MTNLLCVECEAALAIADDPMSGEVVECPECGVELEITSTDPIQIELAPEIEEDWGE